MVWKLVAQAVVLDEIHRAPGCFPMGIGGIGTADATFPRVLGSVAVDLLRQSGESLAGRIEYVPLNPFDVLDVSPEVASTTELWVRGGSWHGGEFSAAT